MIYVSPSLLAADYKNLAAEVKRIEEAGANYLHLDIMDGHFVPNISFGADLVASLRSATKLIFDVHLMISDPMKYIPNFIKAGSDIITVHYESTNDPAGVLKYLRDHEIRTGLAISPDTPAEVVLPLVEAGLCDMVLVMTVYPGFGGQSLIMDTLGKVKKIRRYVDENKLAIDIQVDGGIGESNVGLAASSGANIFVAGSAVFKASDPKLAIANLREGAEKNPYLA